MHMAAVLAGSLLFSTFNFRHLAVFSQEVFPGQRALTIESLKMNGPLENG